MRARITRCKTQRAIAFDSLEASLVHVNTQCLFRVLECVLKFLLFQRYSSIQPIESNRINRIESNQSNRIESNQSNRMSATFRGQTLPFKDNEDYGIGLSLEGKIRGFVSRGAVCMFVVFADRSRAYDRRMESNHCHCAAAQSHLVGFAPKQDCHRCTLNRAAAQSQGALAY